MPKTNGMNKKDIDKLFQDKLGDFREIPDEKVWKSIEQSLNQRKKSRRIIPIWWKLGGAAAILVLGLMFWNPFSGPELAAPAITDVEKVVPDNPANSKVDPNQMQNGESEIKSSEITNTDDDINPKTETNKFQKPSFDEKYQVASEDGSDKTVLPSKSLSGEAADPVETLVDKSTADEYIDPANATNRSEENVAQIEQNQKQLDDTNSVIANRQEKLSETETDPRALPEQTEIAQQETEKNIIEESGKKSIFDEINKEDDLLAEVSGPKWSVGPSIAPVYFNSFGDGSPIHSNFATNSKTGNVNLSYGVAVSYDVSKKLSVRSGLHKVDYGYNTNDISFSSSLVASTSSEITNIDYNSNSRNLVVESNSSRSNSEDFSANDIIAQSPSRNGTMVQEFGYLEVPLELNYALLDRKLSINLVGGVSSLFLVNNSVTLESEGASTEMGEANNLNDLNFSTNVGLGINYKLNNTMKVHLEPIFKYQLNMFSDVEGNFQPYSLGVYTGMSFKF